jgi:hypothetical protein
MTNQAIQDAIVEMKILWIIGALERLATFGLLNENVPYKLTPKAIDDYLMIDEIRDKLFPNDDEIVNIFKELAKSTGAELSDNEVKVVSNLVLQYKNNRTELVKYALEHAK